MKDNLKFWLLSDDARAVHWRGTAPFPELASALKEYKSRECHMDDRTQDLERGMTADILRLANLLTPLDPHTKPAELSGDRLDEYEAARSDEADRLFLKLDDPLLSDDERDQITARLVEVQAALSRADRARRRQERQNAR